ncbi:MAG: 4-demethylwyosine synthase TYW1 [Nitrosopumilaceae archaeon]|nr:4-demethylwyosine synthase TYW1 [Nitrosopumilaceae archaeon]NDB62808.1 4-demethylwyosine synthase TYW1 [Nitrosopumilaceae archaeon]NDB92042.1 4-demethylwyosine synthase TYW1 [Nitrososphaeria archaeon]NDF26982.1 4-demethylwyosine synthase TYW1 [Nitrosopumilaceae archaeon]
MSCSGEFVENDIIQIKSTIQQQLKKAKYGISDHSTVELCHWTKKSFKGEESCYKHKFYGISTHQCMEFSPAGMYCENRCVYCWRPMEFYDSLEMNPQNVAEPEDIVNNLMTERRKLIMGFYGDPRAITKKLDESLLPAHYAISLSGEPTMYPKLPQLIRYLKTLPATKSIFLVTNGQEPQMLKRLQDEDALPTQIYLSTNAADHDSFMRINKPRYSDSWERWNQSLELLQNLDTRTVLRMTMIRNHNDSESMIPVFADMIKRANVHFIEIKSYMHIGRSTNRLDYSDMLEFDEISHFANQLAQKSQIYSVSNESTISRIVLLQNQQRQISPFISAYAQTS